MTGASGGRAQLATNGHRQCHMGTHPIVLECDPIVGSVVGVNGQQLAANTVE